MLKPFLNSPYRYLCYIARCSAILQAQRNMHIVYYADAAFLFGLPILHASQ